MTKSISDVAIGLRICAGINTIPDCDKCSICPYVHDMIEDGHCLQHLLEDAEEITSLVLMCKEALNESEE